MGPCYQINVFDQPNCIHSADFEYQVDKHSIIATKEKPYFIVQIKIQLNLLLVIRIGLENEILSKPYVSKRFYK